MLALKRGGDYVRVAVDPDLTIAGEPGVDLIALSDALDALCLVDARRSRVVELRFFGGLTVEETAELMGISPKTVKRDWSVARAWLHREIRGRTAL